MSKLQIFNPPISGGGSFGPSKFGDVSGGNYSEFEDDGTLEFVGDASVWDDLEGQLFAQRLDTSSGRIDYNFTDITVDFQTNARYPNEPVMSAHQMRHRYKFGTLMYPHLHWIQNQNDVPNWLLAYRVIENGGTVGAFALAAWSSLAFVYSAGTILQIALFPTIAGVSTISFSIDTKLYRDSANASGLFADTDPYTGVDSAKFFDIHFINDTVGSREEYVK